MGIPFLAMYGMKNECMCPPESIYKNVYSRFIHSSQKPSQHKCLLTGEQINK